jgi:drug/metabolite transporter (DMT)-like permease
MPTAAMPVAAAPKIRLPFWLLVAVFCLLWASAFSVAKLAIADCPPLLLLAARFLLAGLVVFGAAAAYGLPLRQGRRDLLLFAALGVANQAVYLGLGYIGMRSMSSGLAALIISANPVLAALGAALFLGERMSWQKVVGLLAGVGGVAFVVQNRLAGGADHVAGIVLAVGALISLVAGTILFKRFAPSSGPLSGPLSGSGGGPWGSLWVGNGVQSLAAGLATLPFALAFERVGDIVPTWSLLAAMAYLVLIVSVFAYLLWFHMLSVSGATAASSYHFLMPPLGLLFGWLLLGEPVAGADLLGIVPVAFGIYLVTRPVGPAHTGASAGPQWSRPADPRPRRAAPGHGGRTHPAAASPPRPWAAAGDVRRGSRG